MAEERREVLFAIPDGTMIMMVKDNAATLDQMCGAGTQGR